MFCWETSCGGEVDRLLEWGRRVSRFSGAGLFLFWVEGRWEGVEGRVAEVEVRSVELVILFRGR